MSANSSERTSVATEHGFVAGAETLMFGALVFVVGTIIGLNAWLVVDAKFAASAAARAAVRTAVEAEPGDNLLALATRAAEVTFDGYRSGSADLQVLPQTAMELRRCSPITIRVQADVTPVLVARVTGSRTFTVTAQHSEVIDPYRARLPLGTRCAW